MPLLRCTSVACSGHCYWASYGKQLAGLLESLWELQHDCLGLRNALQSPQSPQWVSFRVPSGIIIIMICTPHEITPNGGVFILVCVNCLNAVVFNPPWAHTSLTLTSSLTAHYTCRHSGFMNGQLWICWPPVSILIGRSGRHHSSHSDYNTTLYHQSVG